MRWEKKSCGRNVECSAFLCSSVCLFLFVWPSKRNPGDGMLGEEWSAGKGGCVSSVIRWQASSAPGSFSYCCPPKICVGQMEDMQTIQRERKIRRIRKRKERRNENLLLAKDMHGRDGGYATWGGKAESLGQMKDMQTIQRATKHQQWNFPWSDKWNEQKQYRRKNKRRNNPREAWREITLDSSSFRDLSICRFCLCWTVIFGPIWLVVKYSDTGGQ